MWASFRTRDSTAWEVTSASRSVFRRIVPARRGSFGVRTAPRVHASPLDAKLGENETDNQKPDGHNADKDKQVFHDVCHTMDGAGGQGPVHLAGPAPSGVFRSASVWIPDGL